MDQLGTSEKNSTEVAETEEISDLALCAVMLITFKDRNTIEGEEFWERVWQTSMRLDRDNIRAVPTWVWHRFRELREP